MYIPPIDKLLHLSAGAMCALAGLAAGMAAKLLGADVSALWSGLLVCVAAALLREAWNWRWGGRFDWLDASATVGGGALVLAAYVMGGGA